MGPKVLAWSDVGRGATVGLLSLGVHTGGNDYRMTADAGELTDLDAALDSVAAARVRLAVARQSADAAQRDLQSASTMPSRLRPDGAVLAGLLGVSASRVYELRRNGR